MSNTKESVEEEITGEFAKADLLSSLIRDNVQKVAENVISVFPKDRQYIADAKVGSYEVWVGRLCGLLPVSERDYLLQLLQQHGNKLETR
jgi:hypothetical protein